MVTSYPVGEPVPGYGDADQYDLDNPWSASDDFYLELAKAIGGPVLDAGCGTGQLTRAFAAAGLDASGVDVTPAMLERARLLSDGLGIEWVTADVRTMQLGRAFRLITMTGHAFQCLLSDDDIEAFLDRAHQHLLAGGYLAFETRNYGAKTFGVTEAPAFWRSTVDAQGRIIDLLVGGRLDVETGIEDLTFVDVVRETGERTESRSALRYVTPEWLGAMLRSRGFTIVEQYGDWQGGPLGPSQPEIITVCSRA